MVPETTIFQDSGLVDNAVLPRSRPNYDPNSDSSNPPRFAALMFSKSQPSPTTPLYPFYLDPNLFENDPAKKSTNTSVGDLAALPKAEAQHQPEVRPVVALQPEVQPQVEVQVQPQVLAQEKTGPKLLANYFTGLAR